MRNSKGISAVIATLLMLVITVAIAITAYGYVGGLFETTTSQSVELVDASCNLANGEYYVTVRNTDQFSSVGIDDVLIRVDDVPVQSSVEWVTGDGSIISAWNFNEGQGLDAKDSANGGNTAYLGGNLLQNPGFENGQAPWEFINPDTSIETDASNCRTGTSCAKWVKSNSNWVENGQIINAVAGTRYKAGGWFKTDGTGGRVGIWMRTAGSCGASYLNSSTTTNSEYTYLEIEATLPGGCDQIRVFGSTDAPAGTELWMDDVTVTSDAPTWTMGRHGGGLFFDGTVNNWVNVTPDAMDGLIDFTVAYWMNSSDQANQGTTLHATDVGNNEFMPFDYNNLIIHVKGSTSPAYGSLTDGNWRHVAITRDGTSGTVEVFTDGVSQGSSTENTGALNVQCLVFGQEQDAPCGGFAANQAFSGTLDTVRIYNQVLSPEEIMSLYNAPSEEFIESNGGSAIAKIKNTSPGAHRIKIIGPSGRPQQLSVSC